VRLRQSNAGQFHSLPQSSDVVVLILPAHTPLGVPLDYERLATGEIQATFTLYALAVALACLGMQAGYDRLEMYGWCPPRQNSGGDKTREEKGK